VSLPVPPRPLPPPLPPHTATRTHIHTHCTDTRHRPPAPFVLLRRYVCNVNVSYASSKLANGSSWSPPTTPDCSPCPLGFYEEIPCSASAGFPFDDRICAPCARFSCVDAFEHSVGCPNVCVPKSPVSFSRPSGNAESYETTGLFEASFGAATDAVVRLSGYPNSSLSVALYRSHAPRSKNASLLLSAQSGNESSSVMQEAVISVSLVSWSGGGGSWGTTAAIRDSAGYINSPVSVSKCQPRSECGCERRTSGLKHVLPSATLDYT
jgi:hypothetical protein